MTNLLLVLLFLLQLEGREGFSRVRTRVCACRRVCVRAHMRTREKNPPDSPVRTIEIEESPARVGVPIREGFALVTQIPPVALPFVLRPRSMQRDAFAARAVFRRGPPDASPDQALGGRVKSLKIFGSDRYAKPLAGPAKFLKLFFGDAITQSIIWRCSGSASACLRAFRRGYHHQPRASYATAIRARIHKSILQARLSDCPLRSDNG